MKKLSTLFMNIVLVTVSFAQQRNLVENPSFETGEISPWEKGPTPSYTVPLISSTNSFNGIYHATYINTKSTGFYQDISIEPTTKYTLSFWYKSSGSGRGGRLWSQFITEDKKIVDLIEPARDNPLKNNNRYLAKTNEWKQHIVEFTSPDNIIKLQLALRAYNNSTVSFDDFSLTEGSLSVIDHTDFKKQVKISAIISDKLQLILPSKSTVNIYTINGQLVSSNRIDAGTQFIYTASLAKGAYIVTVDNGNSKLTQKVIKK